MQLLTDDGQDTWELTTHVRKAPQAIEAVYAGHTQQAPPAFDSDGIHPDNPNPLRGYAGHCSKLAPRIYAREVP